MIRVLIVDDHPLVRQGLTVVLAGAPDIEVVDAVADGSLAAAAAEASRADIVLMDLSMPGTDGVQATAEVLDRCPDVRVVVLTSFAEQARVLAALDAGAIGYLLKDTEPDDLVQGVRDAADGNAPISPRAALALLPQRGAPRPAPDVNLSAREREVLALVAVGLPEQERRASARSARRPSPPDADPRRPRGLGPHLRRARGAAQRPARGPGLTSGPAYGSVGVRRPHAGRRSPRRHARCGCADGGADGPRTIGEKRRQNGEKGRILTTEPRFRRGSRFDAAPSSCHL